MATAICEMISKLFQCLVSHVTTAGETSVDIVCFLFVVSVIGRRLDCYLLQL